MARFYSREYRAMWETRSGTNCVSLYKLHTIRANISTERLAQLFLYQRFHWLTNTKNRQRRYIFVKKIYRDAYGDRRLTRGHQYPAVKETLGKSEMSYRKRVHFNAPFNSALSPRQKNMDLPRNKIFKNKIDN